MKRLHYIKPNNLSGLHDQILTAIPALRPVLNTRGENEPIMRVEGLGDEVWLTVPDTEDEAAIGAVVQTHDPTTLPTTPAQTSAARRAELLAIPRSDWTTAQMRELLQLVAVGAQHAAPLPFT
jgi:septal ring-binding cell division protein DamX